MWSGWSFGDWFWGWFGMDWDSLPDSQKDWREAGSRGPEA
jgi:hypothetical protein